MKTVSRSYDSYAQARAAVDAVEKAGIPSNDVSFIANKYVSADYDDVDAVSDTAAGAGIGGVVGGGVGLLAGLGLLAIPGLGLRGRRRLAGGDGGGCRRGRGDRRHHGRIGRRRRRRSMPPSIRNRSDAAARWSRCACPTTRSAASRD